MTINQYTELTNQLTSLAGTSPRHSEAQNFTAFSKARAIIEASSISDRQQQAVIKALSAASNPSGYYCESNGINAALETLAQLQKQAEESTPAVKPLPPLNLQNLKNLVSDGGIFSVEFIKRTDGSLRKMVCRLGVKKHLKGGTKAYDAKKQNLLTVFDMEKGGYRSIPIEAVRSLSVNGQSFQFA